MIWCREDGPSDQSAGEERERREGGGGEGRTDEATARCTHMCMYTDELLTSEHL